LKYVNLSENGEETSLQFFVKIRDRIIALWHNKDILRDEELFHAWTWAYAFT